MKILFRNLFSLGFVQGVNLLIPLLITPFLIKTIGVEPVGVIATAQSVINFFIFFVDFGFSITSVRRIAQAKNNKEEIEKIINGVFFLKLFLLVVSSLVFMLLITTVDQFRNHFFLYLTSFAMVIGQAFLPIWFFQGIEKLSRIIIPIVIFKIINILLVFSLVKSVEDGYLVNLIFGCTNILIGCVLYFMICRKYKISRKSVSLKILKKEFRGTLAIFVGNLSVIIYTQSPILILSFFLTPYVLGIYSVVDRITQIAKALLGLVHQVTYPRLCNIVKEAESDLFPFIIKVYGIIWVGIFGVCLIFFFQPSFIVGYFVKDAASIEFTSRILRYFSFILFISSLNMPSYQGLLAYSRDWLVVKILLIGAILSILLNLILIPTYFIEGTVISSYVVEITVTTLLAYYMIKLRKRYESR